MGNAIKPRVSREEAIERLHGWVKPGDTVYTIMRHQSTNGMFRVIDPVIFDTKDGKAKPGHIGYNVAAAIGCSYDEREGCRVGGTGMDMGFWLVYELSARLYPDGFACIGEGCPANDHSNGHRDYTPGNIVHRDGGYALRHRWL